MRYLFFFCYFCLIFTTKLFAQHPCAAAKTGHIFSGQAITAVPGTENYDLFYVHLDLNVERTSNHIRGKAASHARVTAPQITEYVTELHATNDVDSVKINGQNTTFSRMGHILQIQLPQTLTQGQTFIAEVWYNGNPPNSGFFNGISNDVSPSWGAQVTWTLSEPYAARDWWPAKQDLRDKIDSVRIWITTDSSNKAGSNGLIENITPLPFSKHRYEWFHKHPIAYYLISLAVAEYNEYSFNVNIGGGITIPVINYIYNNPTLLPFFQPDIDETASMLQFFSQNYGPYPFANEKYGHCMAPFSGGMEHQTMTTQGSFNRNLTAHELAHQWFGDHVTCASWKDIWVNEGFASYSEYLYANSISSALALQWMNNAHQSVLSAPDGSVYVDDTTSDSRIFSSRLTYHKGGAIIHSLRAIINNDSLFFSGIQQFLLQFGQSNAYGSDVQQVLEQVSSINLQTFFSEWYYGEGYPMLEIHWNNSGNNLLLNIWQTTSAPSSVPAFHFPLEILVERSGLSDTLIRVPINGPGTLAQIPVGGTVTGLQIDPSLWFIKKVDLLLKDPTLSAESIHEQPHIQGFPNPTQDFYFLPGVSGEVFITDLSGRSMASGLADHSGKISLENLPPGAYILHFYFNGQPQQNKIIRISQQ